MNNNIQPSQVSAWVIRNFPDHKLRKGGEQIRINNPFTYDDDYHLEISTTKQFVNDFRGNSWVGTNPTTGQRSKCTFLRFVQLYLTKVRGACSYRGAIEDVVGAAAAFAVLPWYHKRSEPDQSQVVENIALPDDTRPLDVQEPDPVQSIVLNYLRVRRGLSDDKILKYKMMSAGLQIVWPYYEFDELVYWQSRSVTNKRFQFPSESIGVTKGQFLYGFDIVEPASHLIITEAFIDCQTLEEQCLATGGGSMTVQQARKIRLLSPKDGVILAPDNDEAGIKSILHNHKLLYPTWKLLFSIPPKIEYTAEDGTTSVTKDWNDIAVHTDEDPLELLHKRLEILGPRQLFDLRGLLSS